MSTIRRLALTVAFASALAACDGAAAKFIDAGPVDAGPDAGGEVVIDAGIDGAAHPATGTVTGALKAASANSSLYGTLRSGDGSSSSPSYLRRGGVAGATQP